jgi:hypothetical protein
MENEPQSNISPLIIKAIRKLGIPIAQHTKDDQILAGLTGKKTGKKPEDTGLQHTRSGGKSPTGETRVPSGKVLPEIPPEESQEE